MSVINLAVPSIQQEMKTWCLYQVFSLLIGSMVLAQLLLVYWRKRHYRTYQQVVDLLRNLKAIRFGPWRQVSV